MMYLSCRLHKSGNVAIEHLTKLWQQLAQEIKLIDSSTWEIWRTTQVISEDDTRTRLSMEGQGHTLKMVIVSSPCYLRLEQNNHRSTFTLISSSKSALQSMRSLIENVYAPVHIKGLDVFIQQNSLLLYVQAIRLYQNNSEYNTDCEYSFSFGQPVMLRKLLARESSSQVLSLTANVDIKAPFLRVHMLHVSSTDSQVGFSVETDTPHESALINSLFTLADQTFKGRSIDSFFRHE